MSGDLFFDSVAYADPLLFLFFLPIPHPPPSAHHLLLQRISIAGTPAVRPEPTHSTNHMRKVAS
jgi:hypothetical protein